MGDLELRVLNKVVASLATLTLEDRGMVLAVVTGHTVAPALVAEIGVVPPLLGAGSARQDRGLVGGAVVLLLHDYQGSLVGRVLETLPVPHAQLLRVVAVVDLPPLVLLVHLHEIVHVFPDVGHSVGFLVRVRLTECLLLGPLRLQLLLLADDSPKRGANIDVLLGAGGAVTAGSVARLADVLGLVEVVGEGLDLALVHGDLGHVFRGLAGRDRGVGRVGGSA